MCWAPKIGTSLGKLKDMFWPHCQQGGNPTPVLDSRTPAITWFSHVWLQRQRMGRFNILKSLCMHGVLKWPLISVPRWDVE